MTELDPAHVAQALERLAAIELELGQMCQWADKGGPACEWAAISLEDAAQAVAAAGWRLERAAEAERPDRARVAQLKHRRVNSYSDPSEG